MALFKLIRLVQPENIYKEVLVNVPEVVDYSGTIAPTNTAIAISFDATVYSTNIYNVTLTTGSKWKTFEVKVDVGPSGVSHSVYKVSGAILSALDVSINGSNVEVSLTNNEAIDLDYSVNINN